MAKLKSLYLKASEDRRIKQGHLWVFSNEIDTKRSPLKEFSAGENVSLFNNRGAALGSAYINPNTLLCARIYSHKADVSFDADLIRTRLTAALALREHYFQAPYYRLCFGEGDLLPGIIIDRFNDILVLQLTTQGAWQVLPHLKEILLALLQPRGIFLKNEQASLELEGLAPSVQILSGEVPEELLIYEAEIPFYIPLHGGQKTGWFFDQRHNRAQLQNLVRGKTVLDVFAYLGSFGIYAGVYGASAVSFIESSSTACEYIAKNVAVNQLTHATNIINEDAFTALKHLRDQGQKFDVVMVDPPAFIKRKKDVQEGLLAYQRINALALSCLKDEGILVSSSCSMHCSLEDLRRTLSHAAKNQCQLSSLGIGYQAADHPSHLLMPETLYLKTLFSKKSRGLLL